MADHDIIDPALYRAILHAVAAGACRVAAREDSGRAAHWRAHEADQRRKCVERLHQAASASRETTGARAKATSGLRVSAGTPVSRSRAMATRTLGVSSPPSTRL